MKKLLSVVLTFVILLTMLCVSANAVQTLVLGDVSGNGVVGTADVQSILLNINSGEALPEETAALADYDFNGAVDKKDAYSVLKCAAGIVSTQKLEFTDWQVTTQPTCTSEGSAQSVCESKGIVRTKTVAKLSHNYVNGVCSMCGQADALAGEIFVKSKCISFGDSVSKVTDQFGEPTEILSDVTSGGAEIQYYVYAQDYSELVIFTCSADDGLLGVYTNDSSAQLTLSESVTFENVADNYLVDDVYMFGYVDEIGTNAVHAFYATTSKETSRMCSNTNFTAQEKLIFHCVNGSRAQNDKNALIYDAEIAEMALYHSKDMADNNYFSHTAPNGETFADRVSKFNISCTLAGENIAAGNIMSAYDFNDAWYNSTEGHRENMLADYTHLGVGIAYNADSDYIYYATENFRSLA